MSKQRNIFKAFLVLVVIVSGMASTTSTAHAQVWDMPHYSAQAASPSATFGTQRWRDRSDELPGIYSTEEILLPVVLIGAGVVTTVLVLRSRKNKKKKEEEARKKAEQAAGTASLSSEYSYRSIRVDEEKSLQERLLETQRQVPVNLILGLRHEGPVVSDKALVMGVSVTF